MSQCQMSDVPCQNNNTICRWNGAVAWSIALEYQGNLDAFKLHTDSGASAVFHLDQIEVCCLLLGQDTVVEQAAGREGGSTRGQHPIKELGHVNL